jgi:hypothetical protein
MSKLQHIIQNSHGSESGQLKECCNCEALLMYTANILTRLACATSMPAMDLGAPHRQPGRGLLKHWSSVGGFPQPQARTTEAPAPGPGVHHAAHQPPGLGPLAGSSRPRPGVLSGVFGPGRAGLPAGWSPAAFKFLPEKPEQLRWNNPKRKAISPSRAAGSRHCRLPPPARGLLV